MKQIKTLSETPFPADNLAGFGVGQLAYLRQMRSEDLTQRFPELPPMQPGMQLWALFSASGEPIILSDAKSHVLAGAQEHELQTISLN